MHHVPEIMTIFEAADYLRLSTSTIRRMINADEIAASTIRGQIRIRREDLDALLSHS